MSSDDDEILSATGSATSSLILFQALSRLLTFALNALVIRRSTPSLLGLVARFDLIAGTVGVLCRESLRVALLRSQVCQKDNDDAVNDGDNDDAVNDGDNDDAVNDGDNDDAVNGAVNDGGNGTKMMHRKALWTRQFVNMVWIGVAIAGLVIAALNQGFCRWWIPQEVQSISESTIGAAVNSIPTFHYQWIVNVYSIAALIEVVADLGGLLLLYHQRHKERIQAESTALLLKTILIFWWVITRRGGNGDSAVRMIKDYGLLPIFPLAQLAYSTSLAVLFALQAKRVGLVDRLGDLLPSLRPFTLNPTTCWLYVSLSRHALLRFAITQGDQWLMTTVSGGGTHAQGIYATVSNYGSLVCRILLQPIEEASLTLFSRSSFGEKSITHDNLASHHDGSQVALHFLAIILRFDIYLSMGTLVFGPPFTGLLVRTLLGRGWAVGGEMSAALAAYCFLIPPMAFCGILEAFLHGTIATGPRLVGYQRVSLAISIGYLGLASLLVGGGGWGAVGLIAANALAFTCRAIYGVVYLRDFLGSSNDRLYLTRKSVIPPRIVWVVVGLAAVLNYASWWTVHGGLDHFFVGLTTGVICLLTIARFDRAFMLQLFRFFLLKEGGSGGVRKKS